ncbi:hypothetical protein ACFSM5_05350 [Lacibacterium aquatile]|uniref:Exo-alpha-sialidase n=1 Tax=Lacibacterium aquatile TaxID=1168082 RepID=A0ABW5DP51_9PROT
MPPETEIECLICMHRGMGDDDQIYWSIGELKPSKGPDPEILVWGKRYSLGRRASSGVSLYRRSGVDFPVGAYADENGRLTFLQSSAKFGRGYEWTASLVGDYGCLGTPTILEFQDRFWIIFRGKDTYLYYAVRGDDGQWAAYPLSTYSEFKSQDGPGAAVVTGSGGTALYALFDSADFNEHYIRCTATTGGAWTSPPQIIQTAKDFNVMRSRSRPSILDWDGLTYVAHSGSDDSQIWTAIVEGQVTAGKGRLVLTRVDISNQPMQTNDGPTLVALKDKLYLFYRDVEEAWTMFAQWQKQDPWNTSPWVNPRYVGDGDERHQGYYEIGVCTARFVPGA